MEREVELVVPELNYLDAVANACEEWMSEHNSPESFYESAEVKRNLKEAHKSDDGVWPAYRFDKDGRLHYDEYFHSLRDQ